MPKVLLINIRLQDGRFHGMGDEPPCPARLFQALVAGAGLSGPLADADIRALNWLEKCDPPVIAAPRMTNGTSFKNFVPNNDLDAKSGDPRQIGAIRTSKPIRPRLFDSEIPFYYAWPFDDETDTENCAESICNLSERLYQFGRTVDVAWAWGEILDGDTVDQRLANYQGIVYRPSKGGNGMPLRCPTGGSLSSLQRRHVAKRKRFKVIGEGRTVGQSFSQEPKPRFKQVVYDSPPARAVYELREPTEEAPYLPWPMARAAQLVVAIRDGAVERLAQAMYEKRQTIERVFIGRKPNGENNGPSDQRVRLVPLPSIGHHYVDHDIRRVLVEVPSCCPLRADDVHWAISGLELNDQGFGRKSVLMPSVDAARIFKHYGIDSPGWKIWRTVTPVAIPESAARRRIDPAQKLAEAKHGNERRLEQERAAGAVIRALRFAGITAWAESISVQREPFESKGQRVEDFAKGTRFPKERLWHVKIQFAEPISGPIILGDGRFLGLGLMAPIKEK